MVSNDGLYVGGLEIVLSEAFRNAVGRKFLGRHGGLVWVTLCPASHTDS